MASIRYNRAEVDGFKVFYREAGNAAAPKLLLLHGFPTAGHMFRDLIPLLADRYHMVAPDLPGFGQSDMPPRGEFGYTFDNLARVIERFTEVIGFERYDAPNMSSAHSWHTFASLMISNGEDIVRVSRLMGHATASFTLNVYSHMLPREHDPSGDRLASLVFGNKMKTVANLPTQLERPSAENLSKSA